MSRAQSKADAAQAAQAAVLAELRPGQSVELLKELHILTREGRLNQDSRRKLKQVYHLYQFIEPLLAELSADGHAPLLADHGAGKSYLGFILYDLFFKSLGRGEIYGIEWRAELVERSRALAQRLGFERMQFLDMAVADAAVSDGDYAAAAACLHEFVTRVRRHIVALMRLVEICVDDLEGSAGGGPSDRG